MSSDTPQLKEFAEHGEFGAVIRRQSIWQLLRRVNTDPELAGVLNEAAAKTTGKKFKLSVEFQNL